MARRIYLVELEIEADDEPGLPTISDCTEQIDDRSLSAMLMRAAGKYTAKLGIVYSVEAVTVLGTREG